jgi:Putative prokaryotic signal transducing protein
MTVNKNQRGSMRLFTVGQFGTEWEAALAINLLERNGIRATSAGVDDELVAGAGTRGLPSAGLTVVVAEADLERAARLLQKVRRRPSHADRLAEAENKSGLRALRVVLVLYLVVILSCLIGGLYHAWFEWSR